MKKISRVFIIMFFVICALAGVTGYLYSDLVDKMENGFHLNGEEHVIIEYGNRYEEAGFIANIDGKDYIKNVKVSSDIDLLKLGTYEIKYSLTIMNYTKTLIRTVTIVDTQPPNLELKCNNDIYVMVKGTLDNCEYKAYDNYDRNINDKVIVNSNVNLNKKGNYKITYSVSDSSNNTTKKTINVHVQDKFDVTYIKIYISKQRLDYYQNGKIVLTTPVTTGKNNATRTGKFKVWNKVRNATLKGKDYESVVSYWMAYDGNSFGIHDAPWRSNFGSQSYKWNGSHGCVNVPTSAAAKLYKMVEIGTPVYIYK